MQTLSPTISPTISKTANHRVTDIETGSLLSAIAQSSVLQTALTELDANLNDELDRYRHWQANGQTISYLNPFRPRAISTQSIWTSPSLSDALLPIEPIAETNSDRRTIQMPMMPAMGKISASSPSISPPINISTAELHNFRGLENLHSLENLEDTAYDQDRNGYGNSTMGLNSAKVPERDDDEILQSFANDYGDHYQDSIDQDQEVAYPIPSAPNEKSGLRSLMNPVGIISLLLLLCSSAAIGYLMVDPSGVMKLFKPEARPKSSQADGKNSDLGSDINLQNQQKASDSLSFVPFASDKTQSNQTIDGLTKNNKALTNSPKNLLANPSTKSSSLFAPSSTFVPSTPLRTLPSTAFPSISVAPLPPALAPLERSYSPPAARESAPATSYSPPRSSTNRSNSPAKPTTAVDAPSVPAYVAPRRNTAVKYAAPLSSAPDSSTASVSPAPSSYRVVVETNYAASAQQVFKDAYVRPSDGQVQIGAYRDPSAAQNRIEQLRRQGIPARIE
ncbi:MAG: hypothetical protein LH649_13305 [Pseudanabaena sp. CAN_BIN31]|nr:hypothetical protein [Pseudanabaena sp. CAN_BIN31]